MQSKMAGKLFFSGVTVAGCFLSQAFWDSRMIQIMLVLVLLAVWFDRRILARFNTRQSEAPPKPDRQHRPR